MTYDDAVDAAAAVVVADVVVAAAADWKSCPDPQGCATLKQRQ